MNLILPLSLNLSRYFLNEYTAKNIVIYLISWCANFVERHSFRIVSGDSPETVETVPFHKISTPGNSQCTNFNDINTMLEILLINTNWSSVRDYSFSTYAKFSKKTTFLKPWYAHVRVSFSENFANVLNKWFLTKPTVFQGTNHRENCYLSNVQLIGIISYGKRQV